MSGLKGGKEGRMDPGMSIHSSAELSSKNSSISQSSAVFCWPQMYPSRTPSPSPTLTPTQSSAFFSLLYSPDLLLSGHSQYPFALVKFDFRLLS